MPEPAAPSAVDPATAVHALVRAQRRSAANLQLALAHEPREQVACGTFLLGAGTQAYAGS